MSFDLRGKVVFITGASAGIGRACAVEFHRAGSLVAGASRSADKLAGLRNELSEDRFLPVVMDVMDPAQREAGLAQARRQYGRIDVLVNNAGWASFGPVVSAPREHVERMFKLNFFAPVALIQAVLPEMIERRCGQIINISSVVGTQPIARMTLYGATKAALNALTAGLRMELRGTGVDVLLVAPGSTATDFFSSAATVQTRVKRFAQTQYSPGRVARAVVRSSRRRRREVTLSAEGRAITVIRRISPRLADAIMVQVARSAMPAVHEPDPSRP